MEEYLSLGNQRQGILEWYLDELAGLLLLLVPTALEIESNLVSKGAPYFIFLAELLVVHTTFVSEHHQDVFRPGRRQPVIKESCLLSYEPFP